MKTQSMLAFTALALSLVACSEPPPTVVETIRPVRYQKVATSNDSRSSTLVGLARASVESRLSFRVSGTVDSVSVGVGETVRQGQTLARLDPTDYELQRQEAEATRAQASASLRQAEAEYERARALYENRNASKSDLDAARAAAESARAQVTATDKRVEQARRQISYTTLKSPAAGVIAQVAIEPNETTSAGNPVFVLNAGSQPEVEVAVPQSLISSIQSGQPVDVSFDGIENKTYKGRVSEVGVATLDAATFIVTVQLEEEASDIRSGLAANVRFNFPNAAGQESLFLDPVSVGEDAQGSFVFVLKPDATGDTGVAQRRSIQIGQLTALGLEVTEGLTPGDLVATAGVRRLTDGMKVRLLGAETQG